MVKQDKNYVVIMEDEIEAVWSVIHLEVRRLKDILDDFKNECYYDYVLDNKFQILESVEKRLSKQFLGE
ncbi:MAG: hypothetical protein IJ867_01640 [Clostridia bacterium]|nr:hypothetical protein [Clostridia bacterium]